MLIDPEKCIGCTQCIPYCPFKAISMRDEIAEIDLEECVECSNCLRNADCPPEAIYQQELHWPRITRSIFSNTIESGLSKDFPGGRTDLVGRGTDEMKTNDVTGRFKRGYAGIAMEFGRPIVGTRFNDVEKVATAVASMGTEFEKLNPVTDLMEDPRTGKFRQDILNEKVATCILEFTIELSQLPELIKIVKIVAQEIETVFSFDLITRLNPDGSNPTEPFIKKAGLWVAPNGKLCVGLGRPRAKED